MPQTERFYWIDAQIRDRRYPNAERVAEHFNVSRRTAFKDRDYLLASTHRLALTDTLAGGSTPIRRS